MRKRPGNTRGFTLLELLVATALAATLLTATGAIVANALGSADVAAERNELQRDARFAMDRMVRTVRQSRNLLLPLTDNPLTDWPEHIREQTIPASPPVGSSTFATAVLAVTLPADIDLDADGYPDADDDRDGRIDEDLPNDIHHDFFPGIMLVDDDGDGSIDEGSGWADDDEGGSDNEDPLDGIDNDGDGSVDEDPPSDNNGDGCAGICGVDDDRNGAVDGAAGDDDDEDGGQFDDPYDPVVFYLDDNRLVERMPVPWNEDGNSSPDGPVDGRDFVTSTIAENVSRFRVERLPGTSGTAESVRLTLELTGDDGDVVRLDADVRLGATL
ncbi:MAG: prepilin-type N-terminal cleavage/methylation domain-containing protein [Woeseiaceae bacterium]|nr:prepilin-type N-terminal cleavage/methylation domain-containing protein [Woeseiaceae bacterium]